MDAARIRWARLASLAGAATLAGVVACGAGSSSEPIGHTIVATSPGTLTPGPQRVLALAADENQDLIGSPDITAKLVLWQGEDRSQEVDAEWVWAIEDVRGFYAATLDFPAAGNYGLSLDTSEGATTPSGLQVVDTSPIPQVGDPAPHSNSRTTKDQEIESLTTDPDPDPRFYDTSVAEAVTSGNPSVVVFATPAFCQTASCGPTLDVIKELSRDYPDVDFVHVEVFENIDDPQGELVEVPTVTEWGLFTEPWAFVMDRSGTIVAAFEGAVGGFEVERALDLVG